MHTIFWLKAFGVSWQIKRLPLGHLEDGTWAAWSSVLYSFWPLYLSTGWDSFPETFIKTPAWPRGIENVPLSVWNIFFMVNYPFKHETFIWPGFGKWCRQTGHQLRASWKWKSPVELQSTTFSILRFKSVVNSFIFSVNLMKGPLKKKKKKNLMDSIKEPGI